MPNIYRNTYHDVYGSDTGGGAPDIYGNIYTDIYSGEEFEEFTIFAAATQLVTSASAATGGGFENVGCFAPVGVGHAWKAAVGGDVFGFHVTNDGINWRPCNKTTGGPHHAATARTLRPSAIVGSATVANRIWAFCGSDNNGGGVGNVLRGTYSPSTGFINWIVLCSTATGDGPAGGSSQHPRQSGRLLALDEANDTLYVCGVDGIARIQNLGGGAGAGTVTNNRALTGETVTGLILDPANPQIGWATTGKAGPSTTPQPGVWRLTNLRSGTVTEAREVFSAPGPHDLVMVDTGTDRYVFVAAMTQGVHRWLVSTNINTGWVNITNDFEGGGTSNGAAGIDAVAVASQIQVLVSCSGPNNLLNSGAYTRLGLNAAPDWVNESPGWTVNMLPWGQTGATWWLARLIPGLMLGGTGYDSCCPRIDPENFNVAMFVGRSGVWRSQNGWQAWRPAVNGTVGVMGWVCAAHPTSDVALAGDGDWSLQRSTDGFTTQMPDPVRPRPGGGMGLMWMGDGSEVAWACGDPFAGASEAGVFTSTNGGQTWVDQNLPTGVDAHGVAIGQNASGTRVLLTVRAGGIYRKVGTGTWSQVSSLTVPQDSQSHNQHFCWPNNHLGRQYVFCTGHAGLLRSDDWGATWTTIHSVTSSGESAGSIAYDPSSVNTLYYTIDNANASQTGLWKVTNSSGSPTIVRIGPIVSAPGPCAVDPSTGIVYFAVTNLEPGGPKLYASPSSNPGTADAFINVTDPQWEFGVWAPCDMTITRSGKIITANRQGGYFSTTIGAAPPPPPPPPPPTVENIEFKAAGNVGTTSIGGSAPAERVLGSATATLNAALDISVSPTGMQQDDWMIATFGTVGGTVTHSAPAAWTQIGTTQFFGGVGISTWRKRAGSSEASNIPYTFSTNQASNRRLSIAIQAFDGANFDNPIDGTNTQGITSTTTEFTHTALTSSGANRIWMINTCKGTSIAATTTFNTVTDFTEAFDICSNSGTLANVNNGSQYKVVGAGSTGTAVVTSSDATTQTYGGIGFLLAPEDSGGGTTLAPGLPAGTTLNNFLFCIIVGDGTTTPVFSDESWTLALTHSSSTTHIWAFYKFAGSSETAPTITVEAGRWVAQILSYTGVSQVTPSNGTTTGLSVDPSALVPTATGAVVLGIGAARSNVNGQTHAFTTTNGTLRSNASMTDIGANYGFGVAEMPDWVSGTVDPQLSDSIAAASSASMTIALTPATLGNLPTNVQPAQAAGTGTANNAIVSTTNASTPQAQTAEATGTANDATVTAIGSLVFASPQTATASGAVSSAGVAVTSAITPAFVPKVEVAFSTPPMSTTPIWVDITQYVLMDSPLQIQRGRTDEFSRVQAGTLTMTVDNTDGRFTRGLSTSPYFPNVHTGNRIRVSYTIGGVNYQRFDGHINQWPTVWQSSTSSVVVVTATDRFKRFGQLGELRSILEEEYLQDAVEIASGSAAYYPLSEPSGSPRAVSATIHEQAPLEIVRASNGRALEGQEDALQFGAGTGPGTDELSAVMFTPFSSTVGKFLQASYTREIGGSSGVSMEVWFRSTGHGAAPDSSIVNRAIMSLSTREIDESNILKLATEGTGKLRASKFTNGNATHNIDSPNVVNDGETHHAVLTESVSGPVVTTRLYLDNVLVGQFQTALGIIGQAFNRLTVGGSVASNQLWSGTLAHVAVYSGTLSSARVSEHYKAGKTGLAGERSDVRIARLAKYVEIPTAEQALDIGDSTVGWQGTSGSQPIGAMQEVEESEGGVLFMSMQGKLTFHRRSRRYNVSPAFTLNATNAEQIGLNLEFPGDDFGLINDAQAARPRNTDVRAVNRDSIDKFGLYRYSTTILDNNDVRAQSVVDWLVNIYGQELDRAPTVSLDLYVLIRNNVSLLTTVLQAEISALLRLSNLPTNAPVATYDAFIEGWIETVGVAEWSLTFNCSPGAILTKVWALGVTGFSELGVNTRLAV